MGGTAILLALFAQKNIYVQTHFYLSNQKWRAEIGMQRSCIPLHKFSSTEHFLVSCNKSPLHLYCFLSAKNLNGELSVSGTYFEEYFLLSLVFLTLCFFFESFQSFAKKISSNQMSQTFEAKQLEETKNPGPGVGVPYLVFFL